MTDEPRDPDKYEELFHDLRGSRTTGQQAPSLRRTVGIAVGLVIGFGLIITAVVAFGNEADLPEQGAVYICGGERVTIVGTDDADIIEGTEGRDVIHARLGDDKVEGLGGNDIICGGAGADDLRGGRGRDRIIGGRGEDVCIGDEGAQDTFEECELEEQ